MPGKSESAAGSSEMKVLIVGLGEIGKANAKYLKGFSELQIDGYDINPVAVDKARLRFAQNFDDYDVYIVCVSTHDPKDMNKPNLEALESVMRRIRLEGKAGALVSIESTVPINTCLGFGHNNVHVVHVPHRYWQESKDHGVNQPRVLGSHLQCCEDKGLEFYSDMLGMPIHVVPSMEMAEASKIVENMHRTVNIALAEEIKLWAEQNGMDFEALREACNTKWNIKIMEARDGIGKHCLRKDTELYLKNSRLGSSIAKSALSVDDAYRIYLQRKEKLLVQNTK